MARLGYLDFDDVTSPLVRELFAYWEEIRDDRLMPRKSAFDPTRVPRQRSDGSGWS